MVLVGRKGEFTTDWYFTPHPSDRYTRLENWNSMTKHLHLRWCECIKCPINDLHKHHKPNKVETEPEVNSKAASFRHSLWALSQKNWSDATKGKKKTTTQYSNCSICNSLHFLAAHNHQNQQKYTSILFSILPEASPYFCYGNIIWLLVSFPVNSVPCDSSPVTQLSCTMFRCFVIDRESESCSVIGQI